MNWPLICKLFSRGTVFASHAANRDFRRRELVMRLFKTSLLAATVIGGLLLAATPPARADYDFAGSGTSGILFSSPETWLFNADGGAASTGFLNNWGSPGVGAGTVVYGESSPAYGIVLTFEGGGPINAASIITGNAAGCAGSTDGGTTFCTVLPYDPWQAFQTGPDTIQFLAQDSSYSLDYNHEYFVNVFFDGDTPTSFSGRWLTDFTPAPTGVPEPASLALLGAGVLGLGLLRRRRG
jgi:hypothetical protein